MAGTTTTGYPQYTDSFNVLVQNFATQVKELKSLVLFRTDSIEQWSNNLSEINDLLTASEKQMAELKSFLQTEKESISLANKMKEMALQQQKYTQQLELILSSHLPQQQQQQQIPQTQLKPSHNNNSSTKRNNMNIPTPSSSSANHEDDNSDYQAQEPPTKKQKKTANETQSNGIQVPKMAYITAEELAAVPQYIKQRLTDEKVNSGVDEIHEIVTKKYKILNMPIHKMTEKTLRKYKDYKSMEVPETKGFCFFCDMDLKSATHVKVDAGTGKAILTVLRHLGRLKMLPSGSMMRYIII